LGQPRTVWTDAHMYRRGGRRSQRADTNWSPAETSTFVPRPWSSGETVRDDLGPDQVAVAANHGVARPVREGFVWKQRGVNAPEHDPRAALSNGPADFVTAQRVACVDSDSDDVARLDAYHIEPVQCLIDDVGIAPVVSGRRRQNVQPPRRNNRHTEGLVTRIDQMNAWHSPTYHGCWSTHHVTRSTIAPQTAVDVCQPRAAWAESLALRNTATRAPA
jgi:hypothetical protein